MNITLLKSIQEAIKKSNVAYINSMDDEEIQELTSDIIHALNPLAESVEGLFNPDCEQQILAIPLSSPETYRIEYECPIDGTQWEQEHDCACNDRCPECNNEIVPKNAELL